MVPRLVNGPRGPALAGLAVSAALLLAGHGRAVPPRDPGPFHPLRVAHEGQAYADALPTGARYRLATGRLPAGLALEADGRLGGTPRETGAFALGLVATETSGRTYPVRAHLTVRSADEAELRRAPPSFRAQGPHATTSQDLRVDVTSTFDQRPMRVAVRLTRPRNLGRPAPLLLFHRGRGFDHDSYGRLHARLASWGIAVASVDDRWSFAGASFMGENRNYDLFRAELGMQSASGVLEAVSDHLLARSDTPGDGLFGAFDPDGLFQAGHSRGGGAAHASHQRSFELRLRGLIYLMAFDLRYFAECAPPGTAPAYPIFDQQPRTPSLIIAAENDGDLSYPIADQLVDRATGPTTQVTVYGAVHNLISDAHPAEGTARITRQSQIDQVADWIVCFVRRWTLGDATAAAAGELDGRLYGPAHQGSPDAAVTSWWPSARTRLLEDAQDADATRNAVGRNLVAGLRRREASVYPPVGDLPALGLRHVLLTPSDQLSIWRVAADAPLDTRAHRRLVLRVAQTGAAGWAGYGLWFRVVDLAGGYAWVRAHEPGVAGSLLPSPDTRTPHDRFVDLHVDLASLVDAGPQPLDRARIGAVDLVLVVRDQARAAPVAVDAVRLE